MCFQSFVIENHEETYIQLTLDWFMQNIFSEQLSVSITAECQYFAHIGFVPYLDEDAKCYIYTNTST